MYIDTHAHYDDEQFDEDLSEVLSSLKAFGVEKVIIPGCDIASSYKSQRIANKNDSVFFAAGIHPEDLQGLQYDYLKLIAECAEDPKCVAIGEIGLDYYWDASNKEKQKEVFISQLQLASDICLPSIVHDRDAHGDSFDIVKEYARLNNPGVFHCYSGSLEMAKELVKRGWYLGFDGPVTYKNARKAIEVLEWVPLDRVLIETDSPYLSPVPNRGKRNDSRNLQFIAEKIAEIKGEPAEVIAEVTGNNALMLFGF